jgi:predicted GH43/DUF377 family glycosyl hydrolase
VYYGPRDQQNRTRTAWIDVDPADPARILRVHDRPALDLGRLGTFDDSGVMPGAVAAVGDELYLFYTGWTGGVSVPYRTAVGLAVSLDGGESFERVSEAPVIDRTPEEPFGALSPYVLYEDAAWRMWYGCYLGWEASGERPEPVYVIRYAESTDGITWARSGRTCIPPRSPLEANGRPWVLRDGDGYRMWYSHRAIHDYRHDRHSSYRIGYADSVDGLGWERRDNDVGIDLSADGWDSQMVSYAAVYEYGSLLHMLYCGNGFGTTGFGHAVAVAR